ncbi:MAG TPA: hypothetical protein PKC54_12860 [Ferruginibacter sp.]|nr:hypothetical protein [Ferruginibacter sp.]
MNLIRYVIAACMLLVQVHAGAQTKPKSLSLKTATVRFADGSSYTGEWKDSLRHGNGTYLWANGNKYTGQWKNGLREGQGIKYDKEGKILQEGTWVKGIFTTSDNMTFYGDEKVLTYPQGTYTGQVLDDRPHGFGIMKYTSGVESEGEWRYGTMTGWGVYRFPNGNIYEGTFNNNPEGHGILVFTNGNYYEGEWKAGKYEGRGFFYYVNQGRYDGEWKAGKKNGFAVFAMSNGDRYVGEFREGEIDGRGTYYNNKGKIINSGTWEKGQFKQ